MHNRSLEPFEFHDYFVYQKLFTKIITMQTYLSDFLGCNTILYQSHHYAKLVFQVAGLFYLPNPLLCKNTFIILKVTGLFCLPKEALRNENISNLLGRKTFLSSGCRTFLNTFCTDHAMNIFTEPFFFDSASSIFSYQQVNINQYSVAMDCINA